MILKKDNKENINTKSLNEVIDLSKILLRISIVILIIVGAYAGLKLLSFLSIMPFIKKLLVIISPLFIGLIIAWLFDPIVSKL